MTTPRNDAALTTNAHPGPADATRRRPSAGPMRPADVERQARQRHGLAELPGRDEVGLDGLPGRTHQRAADAERERQRRGARPA